MKLEQVKRLKELEKENARLKKAVAELTLDKLILKEASEGNCRAPPVAGVAWRICRTSLGSQSAGLAVWWASIARRNANPPLCETMRRPSQAIIRLATRYGRYGYRRITALLRA